MPTCPFAPPPPLFVVAPPWDVPLWWLGLVAVLAVVGTVHGRFYRTRLSRLHPVRRRRIAIGLFVTGDLCLVIACILIFLVFAPAFLRLNAWEHAQVGRDYAQSCLLDALFPLGYRLSNEVLWRVVLPAAVCCILGLILVWTARIRYVDRHVDLNPSAGGG